MIHDDSAIRELEVQLAQVRFKLGQKKYVNDYLVKYHLEDFKNLKACSDVRIKDLGLESLALNDQSKNEIEDSIRADEIRGIGRNLLDLAKRSDEIADRWYSKKKYVEADKEYEYGASCLVLRKNVSDVEAVSMLYCKRLNCAFGLNDESAVSNLASEWEAYLDSFESFEEFTDPFICETISGVSKTNVLKAEWEKTYARLAWLGKECLSK